MRWKDSFLYQSWNLFPGSNCALAPVRRARVREEEFPVFEPNRGVPRAYGAIVQDHVASRTPSQQEGAGPVPPVGFEKCAEAELKPSIEQTLALHLVLGGDQQ